jgi:enoyl-CoA hydratase/carnithine racemase
MELARGDADVRAVVIVGTKDAFCAGADLKFVRSLKTPAEIVTKFLRPLTAVLAAIRELPKPVIAAINGHCVAGGVEMALCCDLIIAADDARIADGHARFGLLPAIGGAHLLSRALGPHKAKEMLFTGDSYSGAELAQLNLVNRAVPITDLESTVCELVDNLAARSPSGLARMKQMVNDGASMPWQLAASLELTLTEAHLGTGAPAEGLAAFAEHRTPMFGNDQ